MGSGLDDYWDKKIRQEVQETPEKNPLRSADSYQVGGTHYQSAIQPWDIIDAWEMDFYEGNALKYLLRYRFKGKPLEDLEKLEHYVKRMKENYLASL